MKSNKWSLALGFIFFWSSLVEGSLDFSLFSGDFIGNGGDVVVCQEINDNELSTTYELLDFYEMRELDGYEIKIDPNATYDEALEVLISRLGLYDQFTQDEIRKLSEDFMSEARFPEDVVLVDIPDSQHIALKKGCHLEQVAIQIQPEFPGEKRYTVSKDLWDRMSPIDQAGLVMHEVIFNKVIENKTNRNESINSRSTRFLTGVLATDRLGVYSYREYIEFLNKEMGIECTNLDEKVACNVEFYPGSEKVYSYRVFYEEETVISISEGVDYTISKGGYADYIKDIEGFITNIEAHTYGSGKFKVHSYELQSQNPSFELDMTGSLISLYSGSPYTFIDAIYINVEHPILRYKKLLTCERIFLSKNSVECILNRPVNAILNESNPLNYLGFRDERDNKFFNYVISDKHKILSAISAYEDIKIEFYENGYPKRVLCDEDTFSTLYKKDVRISCSGTLEKNEQIDFYDNGVVESGGYYRRNNIIVNGEVEEVVFSPSKHYCPRAKVKKYKGYYNDAPKFVRLLSMKELKLKNGNTVRVNPMVDILQLDEKGEVESVELNACDDI